MEEGQDVSIAGRRSSTFILRASRLRQRATLAGVEVDDDSMRHQPCGTELEGASPIVDAWALDRQPDCGHTRQSHASSSSCGQCRSLARYRVLPTTCHLAGDYSSAQALAPKEECLFHHVHGRRPGASRHAWHVPMTRPIIPVQPSASTSTSFQLHNCGSPKLCSAMLYLECNTEESELKR